MPTSVGEPTISGILSWGWSSLVLILGNPGDPVGFPVSLDANPRFLKAPENAPFFFWSSAMGFDSLRVVRSPSSQFSRAWLLRRLPCVISAARRR